MDAPITLEDIQRAKAILAQAEAALGVAQPKAKVVPVPTHPRHLEDPAFGDKTPAVVEWYRDNDPEEYRRRYAGRKTHLEDRRREGPRWVAPERGHSANDKVRNSQERETASLVKTPTRCSSNKDKRRDVEAALRADPAKSNREIARETGTTHPFVAKTRRKVETVTGRDCDLCDHRNANFASHTRAPVKSPCDH
jgi:hypothetical protein